jgi:ferredoxin
MRSLNLTTRQKTPGAGLLGRIATCSTAVVTDAQGAAEIVVDWDECEANAVCEGILPEIFSVDDDDNLQVSNFHPPAELLDQVQEAVDMCPKRALMLKRAAQ